MSRLHKFNFKKLCVAFATIIFCIAITHSLEAKNNSRHEIDSTLTAERFTNYDWGFTIYQDTTPKKNIRNPDKRDLSDTIGSVSEQIANRKSQTSNDTIPDTLQRDSIAPRIDTVNIKIAKDTLDAIVNYEAEDSAVLLVKEEKFLLYGKTKTTYKDVVINAPTTILDQKTNVLTALGSKDSLGNIITRAHFQQGSQTFESESFTYNFKTQKGITANTYTNEGELYIKANVSKKVDPNTVYIKGGYFTTCDLDDPHFGFKANRIKVISQKIAISGPTHPEIEGVPIPIYLPFGIYPLFQGRHSGFLQPTFTTNQQFGLGLEGLGYYHVLNDYYDVTVRANVYSYGGWNLNITPTYRKRYRYSGSFNLSLNHTKIAFKGDPDYSLAKTFQINWNHSVDAKARPGTNFSAAVNAGSTRYNQYIPNNPYRNFQNQLYSSISYSKQWQGKPFSLQLSANHNQNNTSHLINVVLPDAGFTVNTVYPFQRKEMTGSPHWYEKIGVGYNALARNQISFYDTGHVAFRHLLDTMQWGLQHRFPLTLQLPPLGNFFVSPFVSYEETYYTHRFSRRWDSTNKKVDTVTISRGLFSDRQVSFGMGFNTNIYGTFAFKGAHLKAIRHVIRPTISFNYKPNISKRNFDVIQVDSFGRKLALAQFEGNLFAPYSYGKFGGLSFAIDNNLEMKWRGKKDTADRKIKLIDGFGLSSGYNFLQDSFRLQPFSLNLRTTLFEKLSISAQGQIDPYQIDNRGLPVDRFVWNGSHFSLGRFTGGSISASTSFQSKSKDANGNNKSQIQPGHTITDPTLMADQERLQEYMRQNPAEFVDFNIPWSVSLSYSLTLTRRLKPDYSGFTSEINSSVSFNNSFNLTPKWNFNTQGFFDFNTKQLTMFTMNIAREMHCWQMAIGVTPIGNFRYFNVTLSPKSSILRDLRVNRTRYFYNY